MIKSILFTITSDKCKVKARIKEKVYKFLLCDFTMQHRKMEEVDI